MIHLGKTLYKPTFQRGPSLKVSHPIDLVGVFHNTFCLWGGCVHFLNTCRWPLIGSFDLCCTIHPSRLEALVYSGNGSAIISRHLSSDLPAFLLEDPHIQDLAGPQSYCQLSPWPNLRMKKLPKKKKNKMLMRCPLSPHNEDISAGVSALCLTPSLLNESLRQSFIN